jgi:hypothetical protein
VSLGVNVFALAYMKKADAEGEAFLRSSFTRINLALARRGLPEHREPETVTGGSILRGVLVNMSYASFQELGRCLVRCRSAAPSRSPQAREGQQQKALIGLASHLLCHANNAGFYVPVDFAEPLHAALDEPALPGGLVGSSQRLLAELLELAPHLGVDPDHPEAVEPGKRLHEGWHTLHACARVSVAHGTAIWLQ